MSENNKPAVVFKARGVSASVFANRVQANGGEFTMYKTALTKTYKDGNEFKRTSSFTRDEIPVAQMLLAKAYDWIHAIEATAKKDESDHE